MKMFYVLQWAFGGCKRDTLCYVYRLSWRLNSNKYQKAIYVKETCTCKYCIHYSRTLAIYVNCIVLSVNKSCLNYTIPWSDSPNKFNYGNTLSSKESPIEHSSMTWFCDFHSAPPLSRLNARIRVHMCACVFICVCMHIMCVSMYTCIYIYIIKLTEITIYIHVYWVKIMLFHLIHQSKLC